MKGDNRILAGVLAFLVVLGFTLGRATVPKVEPKTIPPNGVVEKFERNDKCYLKVVLEVTPDEYITYDVGDEYGRTEE